MLAWDIEANTECILFLDEFVWFVYFLRQKLKHMVCAICWMEYDFMFAWCLEHFAVKHHILCGQKYHSLNDIISFQ